MTETLRDMIKRHEGLSLTVYEDTTGHFTIGYGHKLGDHPVPSQITQEKAEALLDLDIELAEVQCAMTYGNAPGMTERRRDALIDFLYNVGGRGALGFVKMNAAIKKGNWGAAARELQDSKWFIQVGDRGKDLVKLIKEG